MAERKTRLTFLNKGEFFEFQGNHYEKLEKREHGNNCRNMTSGEVVKFPLMLTINKVDELPKPSRKKKVDKTKDLESEILEKDEQESLPTSVRLRDGREEPTDL